MPPFYKEFCLQSIQHIDCGQRFFEESAYCPVLSIMALSQCEILGWGDWLCSVCTRFQRTDSVLYRNEHVRLVHGHLDLWSASSTICIGEKRYEPRLEIGQSLICLYVWCSLLKWDERYHLQVIGSRQQIGRRFRTGFAMLWSNHCIRPHKFHHLVYRLLGFDHNKR